MGSGSKHNVLQPCPEISTTSGQATKSAILAIDKRITAGQTMTKSGALSLLVFSISFICCTEFVFRTVPLKRRQDYLPRVVDDDQQKFSCQVLEVLKKWIGEFGSSNVELQLLEDFLSYNVHVKVEPEIASTLNELENALHSLFPLVECCTSGTASVTPSCSTDDNLLISSGKDTPVRIKISLDKPSLQRTPENSSTIKRAKESYLRICREFLPPMGRWNRVLSHSRHNAIILRENSFSSFESIRNRLSSLLERIQLAKRKFEDIHFDEDIMIDSDESDFEEVI
ncbi:hypothetical protein T01_13214 [Trichinella spiralis]|uniref:VHS domain-containing protein n=1 Tax=Trichinella spiralis TaxID=6334 RepID=A0A0V1BED0_TRISP|nr:hypothetical protein T01_13214 [Trichinella spiralis]